MLIAFLSEGDMLFDDLNDDTDIDYALGKKQTTIKTWDSKSRSKLKKTWTRGKTMKTKNMNDFFEDLSKDEELEAKILDSAGRSMLDDVDESSSV